MANVLVIAQILDGEVKKSTNSAATCAAKIASMTGGTYSIMAVGENLSSQADALTKLGATKVYLVEGPGLNNGLPEQWVPAIANVVQKNGFGVVVSPASSTGKDVLPRLAARLEAGMASEVTGVELVGDKLTYVRPM
ncbi:MAG: electron transfer flavoprotein subunit alpha/FixB family protein, partial [Myxococcota bacterium]|nr:electron transfer flavoprotein subunit alpha/FixB family protein [Myxococcota bacterium]